jgi:hypothetical protein
MKKAIIVLVLGFSLFILEGCNEDSKPTESYNPETTNNFMKKKKVEICHKGKIISVSVNAVASFQRRGAAVDVDGDGYFDKQNDCGFPVDCDDTDPLVQQCGPSLTYDGADTYLDISSELGYPNCTIAFWLEFGDIWFGFETSGQNGDCGVGGYGGYPINLAKFKVTQGNNELILNFGINGSDGAVAQNGTYTADIIPFDIQDGPITATLVEWTIDNSIVCF